MKSSYVTFQVMLYVDMEVNGVPLKVVQGNNSVDEFKIHFNVPSLDFINITYGDLGLLCFLY